MKIDGRMKVKKLQSEFKKTFGLTLRVYNGSKFADGDATLASIRKGDAKGGEFSPRSNMKVDNFEKNMKELFGIKVQVASADDSSLCKNSLSLSEAKKECK